ncbi:MarR family winged helix-turn-helix transcriptional regulator [Paenibacillus ginsengihumi]|uniref:MarR family winged helix-turn-helix transcriptional regulator n=1 Tax=Paenibacillus ginsengihumi TaxID=431596 RepID=UPI00036632B7|nr:MarR family transcriptional regulator [Paenibacillus ginsengihumi]
MNAATQADDKERMIRSIQQQMESLFYRIRHDSQLRSKEMLPEGQVFLLIMLYNQGTVKATDIAVKLGITSGAVTGMTDKMEKLGLIRRERSEEDRRVVHISLTEHGADTLKRIRLARFNRLCELISQLEIDELQQMEHVFTKMNRMLLVDS